MLSTFTLEMAIQNRCFTNRVKGWLDSPGFGVFVGFSHFPTNAMWSILSAARLFFVRVLSDHSNQSLYLSCDRT